MKVTKRELRRIIREQLSDSQSTPVNGLTGLMQEFDVPMHSRKKVALALLKVYRDSGGPLDASYEVEKSMNLNGLPEEFYTQAIDLVKKEKSVTLEAKRVQITRRQIRLLVKEAIADPGNTTLTEAELNEIAPIIAGLGRAVASIGPVLARGAASVGRSVSKTPKIANTVSNLVKKASSKMPNISKYLDVIDLDLDDPDLTKLSDMIANPPDIIKGEMDKILKNAASEMKKAEKCDCPTLEDLLAAQKEE